jgi:hypothetical protein
VVTEGPPQSFFDQSTGNDATIAEAADKVVPNMPPRRNDHSVEDIHAFTVLGAIVDDDNLLPAPENIPPPNEPLVRPGASNEVFPADGWGFQGTCPRKSNNHANRGPSITKPREIW